MKPSEFWGTLAFDDSYQRGFQDAVDRFYAKSKQEAHEKVAERLRDLSKSYAEHGFREVSLAILSVAMILEAEAQ